MSSKRNYNRKNFRNKSNKNFPPIQRNNLVHQEQLHETDVGITKFISDLEGFSGIIKARFSDFHVSEIDLEGHIAKLTNQTIPSEFLNVVEDINVNEVVESPIKQLPQDIWDSLKALAESEDTSKKIELDITGLTKEDRTAIHMSLGKYFPKKIQASTVDVDNKKMMQFKRFDPKDKSRREDYRWPKNVGEYTHFIVYKESLDTLETCMKIADCVRLSAANFNYAGVKDKRAKTTQWFSAKKLHPKILFEKTKPLFKIKIGNFVMKDRPLKLGQLSGNHFKIALRNVTGSDELIEKAVNSVKENGFINYYGLQRFGNNKEVPTYSIGLQLLLGNFKEACNIILKCTEYDNPHSDVTKAKKVYNETGDVNKALGQFTRSKNKCVEYKLLFGMSKEHENNIVCALERIPRNMRLLYIHSFQSLVWNTAVSKRIEKYGLKVVEGDLVLVEGDVEEVLDDDGKPIEEDDDKEAPTDKNNDEPSERAQVKVLTAADCDNYTIYDIVMPLPGYDILYPENCKEFYKEILESYGLTLEMEKQRVKTYNLSGSYRKILGKVQDLSWKIMYYDDPNSSLIRSDWEEFKEEPEPVSVEGGKYKALILEFSLSSSCYATMLLREIMKTDTSNTSNAKLNDYHKSDSTSGDIKSIVVKRNNENEEGINDQVGLLNDPEKYEEFKKLIMGSDDSPKRKCDDDNNENDSNKKIKLD